MLATKKIVARVKSTYRAMTLHYYEATSKKSAESSGAYNILFISTPSVKLFETDTAH
jgi:hypothetical protein